MSKSRYSNFIFESEEIHYPNRSLSRVFNERAIIEKIYNSNGISMAQISKELGLSKPAVSSNVSRLLEMGLIFNAGQGQVAANGGRKPTLLRLNKAHKYIGALDISMQEIVCVVGDLECNIIEKRIISDADSFTPLHRKKCIEGVFIDIFDSIGIEADELAVVAISQPGVTINDIDAFTLDARHRSWTEIGLAEHLEELFNVHVVVGNDVNLAALGELHFGLVKNLKNLVYVACGVGVGAGIIIDGKIYEGEDYSAGEIGSMQLDSGIVMGEYVAFDGLLSRVKEISPNTEVSGEISFLDVISLLCEGNRDVYKVVYDTGVVLGRAILNMCAVLNISHVTLGGDYLELGDAFLDGIKASTSLAIISKPQVTFSSLNGLAGVYGALIVARDRLLQEIVGG